jgi:hypothetical protein
MTKVVINQCFGGFGLSAKAKQKYLELKGTTGVVIKKNDWGKLTVFVNGKEYYDGDMDRTDPILVQVVEELGKHANADFAKLKVVEIGEGVQYRISEYDGNEHIEYADDVDWSVG